MTRPIEDRSVILPAMTYGKKQTMPPPKYILAAANIILELVQRSRDGEHNAVWGLHASSINIYLNHIALLTFQLQAYIQ